MMMLGRRVTDNAEAMEVAARTRPAMLRWYVVKYRNDEDQIFTLEVIAHSESEVRETMEEVLGRTDFEVRMI